MEKRLNKKLETYFSKLKDDVKYKVTQLGMSNSHDVSQLLQFIYYYSLLISPFLNLSYLYYIRISLIIPS